ncbi:MAG: hypothetical protein RSB39_06070 [Oscillospiraceae bacterium]
MKNTNLVIFAISAFVFMTSCSKTEKNNDLEVPNEVIAVVDTYMDAYKIGAEESVNYAHFESEFRRQAYVNSKDRIFDYAIESCEKINDYLFAFTILLQTKQDADHYLRVYNFVAKIDDTWYYINGVGNIPSELKTGLDEEKYTYGA